MTVQGALANFVFETTETQNTAPKVLLGPANGYNRSFRSQFADGAIVAYVEQQVEKDGNDEVTAIYHEAGLATLTYGDTDTLTPTAIVDSSNGGAAVDWGPGEKTVWSAAAGELIPLMDAVLTAGKQGRPLIVNEDSNGFTIGAPGLGQQAANELTIASGSVTPTDARHTIDTEADASTDTLAHAATTNIPDGGMLMLSRENAARVTTITHEAGGAGQFHMADGADFVLAATILFERRGADWYEVSRGWTGATGNLTVTQQLILSGVLEPAQVTANTDNYNPTNLALASGLKVTTDAARNFTGLAGGTHGRRMTWRNAGAFPMTLIHDATSTAANRFSLPDAAPLTLLPTEAVTLEYDGTLSRWVVASWNATARIVSGYRALKIVSADGGTSSVITCGAVTLEGALGSGKRFESVNKTLNLANAGAGGLDTGTVAAATWYYTWIIGKPDGTVDVLGSLSSTAPTMPSGYTYKFYAGALRTKSASAVLVGTIQYGNEVTRRATPLPSMIAGASGSIATGPRTAVAIANYVPPTASHIIGVLTGATSIAAPNNTYGAYNSTTNPPPVECELNIAQEFCFAIEEDWPAPNVYYASNASNATSGMWAKGWIDGNL